MSGRRLIWRAGAGGPPLDASPLLPAALSPLSEREIGHLQLQHGRHRVPLGELFRIEVAGEPDHLQIEGASDRFRNVGRAMTTGRLSIEGNVGDHLAQSLAGGEIVVSGYAGTYAGCLMTGGVVRVGGDLGDLAGAALAGGRWGMDGGWLLVGGRLGHRAGDRMRRGVIAAVGGAGDYLGARMIGGTIRVGAESGRGVGYGMRRGTVLLPRLAEPPLATFNDGGAHDLGWVRLLAGELTRLAPWLPTPGPKLAALDRLCIVRRRGRVADRRSVTAAPTQPRRYLRPLGMQAGAEAVAAVEAGMAQPLLGGRFSSNLVEVIEWGAALGRRLVAGADLHGLDLTSFERSRPKPFDRPLIFGILNVTPDSFADAGLFLDTEKAIRRGLEMLEQGADLVDVGGESTRPGATPVAPEEELARVLPVVKSLARTGARISIDTRSATVMATCVEAGASVINDVSALTHDADALRVVAMSDAAVVLMHMRGEPGTMNRRPHYRHCALEVHDWLAGRISACTAAGIGRERLILDPGLCFGKHEPHNLDILRHLSMFHGLGCPILLGASRKGWTAAIQSYRPPAARLPGSLVAVQWALDRGVQALRVHDVAATRQALDAWLSLTGWNNTGELAD